MLIAIVVRYGAIAECRRCEKADDDGASTVHIIAKSGHPGRR
jgi:hypothetical protein